MKRQHCKNGGGWALHLENDRDDRSVGEAFSAKLGGHLVKKDQEKEG